MNESNSTNHSIEDDSEPIVKNTTNNSMNSLSDFFGTNVNSSNLNMTSQNTIQPHSSQSTSTSSFQGNNQSVSSPLINKEPSNSSNINTASANTNFQNMDMLLKPSSNANNQDENNEELLKAFIGNNYQKITTKTFNFAGFFFTAFYLFYRKMFLYGLIVGLIETYIANTIKNNILLNIILSIISLLIALCINKIYVSFAKRKIEAIKLQNPKKNMNQLKAICASYGGTSIGNIFLGLIIEVILVALVLFGMFKAGFSNTFTNILQQIQNEIKTEDETYSGAIQYDTSITMQDEFSITVPSSFENHSNSYDYSYSFSGNSGVFNSCTVNVYSPFGFSNANKLMTQMAKYNSDNSPTEVVKMKKNNIEWYSFSMTDAFGKNYYYATNKNGKVFLVEYVVSKDSDSSCENYREQIINSIGKK